MPGTHVAIRTQRITSPQELTGPAPTLRFNETDQTDPAGRYQIQVDADIWALQRAATVSWGSVTDLLTVDENAGALAVTLSGSEPELRLVESAQTDPAGRWRLRGEGDRLYFEQAATASWATDRDYLVLNYIAGGYAIQLLRDTYISHTYSTWTVNRAALEVYLGATAPVGDTSKWATGVEAYVDVDGSNDFTLMSGLGNAVAAVRGYILTPSTFTGSVTSAAVFQVTPAAILGGTFDQWSGVHIWQPTTVGGTGVVTAAYGLYINPISVGALSRSIYVQGGTCEFLATQTVASAAGATLGAFRLTTSTITLSGNTNITTATGFNLVSIDAPTYSAALALTISLAATLYISGAPSGGGAGPAGITTAYALWVDSGNVRLDGDLTFGAAASISTSSGDLTLSPGDDLIINATGGGTVLGSGEGGVVAATGQMLRAPNVITGGAGNVDGADLTIAAGLGTGTGDVGTVIFSLPVVATAGDNLQGSIARLTLDMAASTTILTMAAAQAMTISSTGQLTINGTGATVFNEDGADIDFRVEGDSNANMLVVDAGTDTMGLGAAVVANAFLNVGGTITASAGSATGARFAMTLNAAANADILTGYGLGTTVYAKGAFSGLLAYGMRVLGTLMTVTGAGTIDTAVSFYVTAPTIGTANWAIYSTGAIRLDNYIQLSEMAAPGAGVADTARIYAVIDGGNLTDLAAVFQDGTVDIFAQEVTPLDAPHLAYASGTVGRMVIRKPHPGVVKFTMVFPDGREFVLKEIQYHDTDLVAANRGAEGPLPANWLVETAAERAARNVRIPAAPSTEGP